MKKYFACFLILVSICCNCFPCVSESIDLDSLSEYELIELENQIRLRLFSLDPTIDYVRYPGVYVVGEGIPSGNIIFTTMGLDDGWIMNYGSIRVFKDYETYKNDYGNNMYSSLTVGNSVQFYLEDGNVVQIEHATVTVN